MPVISIRIPQLGEGLQEALLVEFLKQPGDVIKRDDPIYVMETDKATTDVESPYDGKLVEWTAESGSVLEIGAEIGKIEVAEGVQEMPAGHGPESSPSAQPAPSPEATKTEKSPAIRSTKIMIPPKTRKYLKELNLLDQADQIPAAGSKLMPADVDAYLAGGGSGVAVDGSFTAEPLPKSQIVLNYRLSQGAKACVPVTVIQEIDWTNIQAAREKVRDSGGPSGFAMACWGVVQALKNHPKFRSALSADGKALHVFDDVNLGIAVALPGDEMVTAVVRQSDKKTADEFFTEFATQVAAARDGNDQADGSTTMTISNVGKAGVRIGIPAIVAPAVATLAIGEIFAHPVPDGDSFKFKTMVTATMTFDHRIANGVGAANFMNEIKSNIESFSI